MTNLHLGLAAVLTFTKFINSILANIAGTSPTPLIIPPTIKRTPSQSNNAPTNKQTPSQSNNGLASGPLKRKAEQQDSPTNAPKVLKRESKPVTTPSINVKTSPMTAGKDAESSKATPASPSVASAPPRKGTFADIIARAQAAQAATNQLGVIKHKPVGKMSVQERRALREQIKAKKSGNKSARAAGNAVDPRKKSPAADMNGRESRSNLGGTPRDKGKARAGDPESAYKGTSRPARVETEYKGTARPVKSETDYKGTARRPDTHSPISPGRKNGFRRDLSSTKRQPSTSNRYATQAELEQDDDDDEDEERYGEDDEEEYESDSLSDMEAAAFEVEEEEFTSLKKAKKEDEEALREEMELKRKKLERKRALQALASKRRS